MKPKPLSSLNHFTVPVAICSLPGDRVRRNAGGAVATTTNAGHSFAGHIARHDALQSSRRHGGRARRTFRWRVRIRSIAVARGDRTPPLVATLAAAAAALGAGYLIAAPDTAD